MYASWVPLHLLWKRAMKKNWLHRRLRARWKRFCASRQIRGIAVPAGRGEIRMFMKIRNEVLRLPYFFDYYARRGVDRFFIIDNASDDGTAELLTARRDTHVFRVERSFRKENGLHPWVEALLDRYGTGHWCLCADPDEILVYPRCETLDLRALCRYLEAEGAGALAAEVLDMYSDAPLKETVYRAGEDFVSACPYFDAAAAREIRRKPECAAGSAFLGGMTERVFGYGSLLSKVPLFKFGKGVQIDRGHHTIRGARLSDLTAAVLHFKYFSDFIGKTVREAERGEYFNRARRYRQIARIVIDDPALRLCHEGSACFEDSSQLVRMGRLRTSEAYERFALSCGELRHA